MYLKLRILFLASIYIASTVAGLDEGNLFKLHKLNLVWGKAQHSLGQYKLNDLKTDLMRYEHDEMTLKKMKAHSQDKDGVFEAAVRKRLLQILAKYSLERYYDDIHPPKSDNQSKGPFDEASVNRLWDAAIASNFSSQELEDFRKELDQYQLRIKKLKHFQLQIDRRQSSPNVDANQDVNEEDKHIKRRIKDLTYKVDKTHKSFEQRIGSRVARDEL